MIPVFGPVSPQAKAIVDLFYIVLGLCAVILAIVAGIITWSLIRYRGGAEKPEPQQVFGSVPLEVTWTVIPLLIVIGLFALSARAMSRSDPFSSNAKPDLVVIGHQWWWEARYRISGAIAANEIHIPTRQRWLVRLEAADVIHDFWAPRLSRKMDLVPGHPNFIWLEADEPGIYQGACAEFCGAQHAWMRFTVVAEPLPEFEKWQRAQVEPKPPPSGDPARTGADLFAKLTCGKCHRVDGPPGATAAAPDLAHLADRRTLAAGVLENNPQNLVLWLRQPQQFKPGSLMPNLQLTEAKATALAAFLEPSP